MGAANIAAKKHLLAAKGQGASIDPVSATAAAVAGGDEHDAATTNPTAMEALVAEMVAMRTQMVAGFNATTANPEPSAAQTGDGLE